MSSSDCDNPADAEALKNDYLSLAEEAFDRVSILSNEGIIYANNGDYSKALEYLNKAKQLNSRLLKA